MLTTYGEFRPTNDASQDPTLHAARQQFLDRVATNYHGVLLGLRDTALEVYVAFTDSCPYRQRKPSWLGSWNALEYYVNARHGGDSPKALKKGLIEWTKKFSLETRQESPPWFLNTALATLGWWCQGMTEEPLNWFDTGLAWCSSVPHGDDLFLGEYDPQIETHAKARGRLRTEINQYLDRRDAAFKNAIDCEGQPQFRQTTKKYSLSDHINLLVDFQVGNKTYGVLAKKPELSSQAVSEAIKNIAGFLGVELRQAFRTGRPPGRKDNQWGGSARGSQ